MTTKPTMTDYLDFCFNEELHSESDSVGAQAAETVASVLDIVSQLSGTDLAQAVAFAIEGLVEQIAPAPEPMVIIRRDGLRLMKGASQPVLFALPEVEAA